MCAIGIEKVLKKASIPKSVVRNHYGKLYKQEIPITQGTVKVQTREEKVVLALQRLSDRHRSAFVEALLSEALENDNTIEVFDSDKYSDGRRITVAVTTTSTPYTMHIY